LRGSDVKFRRFSVALVSERRRVPAGTFELVIDENRLQVSLDDESQWKRFIYPQWSLSRNDVSRLSNARQQLFRFGSFRDAVQIDYSRGARRGTVTVLLLKGDSQVRDALGMAGWHVVG
jgi:hypothetical protein